LVLDPRKKQKKAERKHAKEKSRQLDLKRRNQNLAVREQQAIQTAPILHCQTIDVLWTQGIGQVLLSRELPHDRVVFSSFLVDMYCLGVKDAFIRTVSRTEYEQKYLSKISSKYSLVKLQPACARKLVEGAVEYARNLGLSPHPDYAQAKLIFGDVDVVTCQQVFEYGKDGKPFFIGGPNDSPARINEVMRALEDHGVSAGFLLPVDPAPGSHFHPDEDDEVDGPPFEDDGRDGDKLE